MPKTWLYYFALVLPLIFRVLMLNTDFINWVWYGGYQQTYNFLAALKVQPQFLTFIGGWPLPVFILTVICWWQMDDDDGIPAQFLLLPLAYVPFTIVGDILLTAHFDETNLYIHPLVIIPIGYVYVFAWTIFIWLLEKLRLVM
jgi:hypothetical protein